MAYNFPPNPSLDEIYTSNGRSFRWNGVLWQAVIVPTANSAPVFISASPPTNPVPGALWYSTTESILKIWVADSSGGEWVDLYQQEGLASAPVYISASPPPNPVPGDLWYSTTESILKIWITGSSGGDWIDLYQQEGSASVPVYISASPPTDPLAGFLWYNTTTSVLNLRQYTLAGGEWIPLNFSPDCPPDCTRTFIGSSPPANPEPGNLWWDSSNSYLNIWYVDLGGGQWVSVVPYPAPAIGPEGGVFIGPIYGNYEIPDDPIAFVTVEWVENYVASYSPVFNLTDAADVDETGLANNSVFVYRSVDAKWAVNVTTLDLVNGGTF